MPNQFGTLSKSEGHTMNHIETTRILELLASKICHDLISPVGAVSNGVEILEELGPEAGEDVTSLIEYSATQAASKLKAMRMVYGLGGGDDNIKLEDVHKTFGDFIVGEARISQDWDPYMEHGIDARKGLAKALLSCLMLCIEGLPKGGEIRVIPDGDALVVRGEGDNAKFKDGYTDSLNHDVHTSQLDPKLIHAYVTGLIAQSYGFEIQAEEPDSNIICLRLTVSTVS